MHDNLFDIMKLRPNRHDLWEAVKALEKLTGREVVNLPEGLLTLTQNDAPEVLREGERVLFHFTEVPEGFAFRPGNVVVQIFTPWGGDAEPVVSFALGRVYHDHGEVFHPLRAAVRGTDSARFADSTNDGRLHCVLRGVDSRAATLFAHMWRLQMGPVLIGASGDLERALYG